MGYGFIAGRGALSAARKDYFKALCWLWNVKCLNHPHSNFQGSFGGVLQKWVSLKKKKKMVNQTRGKLFCSVYYVKQIYKASRCVAENMSDLYRMANFSCSCSPNLQP